MASWIQALLPELLILVPLLAFLESCLVVGLFVSGVFLLGTCTLIYGQGQTSLITITALAFTGAMIGDHAGYFIGYKATPTLWRFRFFRKQLLLRKLKYRKIQRMLNRSAPWAICVGRFIPAIRSISPAAAGAVGIKPINFFAYDLLACSIWAFSLSVLVVSIDRFS